MSKTSGPFTITVGNNTAASNALQFGKAGTDLTNPVVNLKMYGTANSGATYIPSITNAAFGQASTLTIPDPGAATASFVLTSGTAATGSFTTLSATTANVTTGNFRASGTAGTVNVFPTTAANGKMILSAVDAGGAFNTTISNSVIGQSTVFSIPDPGAATAKFLLDTGTGATATITKLSTGATPVPMVDPGSCTITAAAGASNTSTVTVQLKDGAGSNLARSVAFKVYASSSADGLTLASAASTGWSVASGGLSRANGSAVTTSISAMSSATGGCVLSLLDTGKQTSYLVLELPSGNKISAQLSSGSYGA